MNRCTSPYCEKRRASRENAYTLLAFPFPSSLSSLYCRSVLLTCHDARTSSCTSFPLSTTSLQVDPLLGYEVSLAVLFIEENFVQGEATTAEMIDVALAAPPDVQPDLPFSRDVRDGDIVERRKTQGHGHLIVPLRIESVTNHPRTSRRPVKRGLHVTIDSGSIVGGDNLIDVLDPHNQIHPTAVHLKAEHSHVQKRRPTSFFSPVFCLTEPGAKQSAWRRVQVREADREVVEAANVAGATEERHVGIMTEEGSKEHTPRFSRGCLCTRNATGQSRTEASVFSFFS